MTECLLIGHNQLNFSSYVEIVSKVGIQSGAFRYVNTSFINYKNQILNQADLFNLVSEGKYTAIRPGDCFSLTIAYLGSFLHKHGIEFDYINSFNEEKEILKQKLQQDILAVAITTTFYDSALPVIDIINYIKQYNTKVKIIIGGPFIFSQYRLNAKKDFNYLLKNIKGDVYVVSNQGEATLVKIIKSLSEVKSLDNIDNVFYLQNGEYVENNFEAENNLLNENPVKWELFSKSINEYTSVRTSLSCPFSCSFCSYPENAGEYQVNSLKVLEQELDGLAKVETLKNINFIDDTFNIPPKRFKEILKLVISKKYKFKWHSYLRCQYIDRETAELMKQSGCEGVFLGIESGSDQILRNMNKKTSVKKYYDGIKYLKEFDILTFASFIIGFPGETRATVKETEDFIETSGLDFFRAYVWYADRNTPIFKETEKYGLKGARFEWQHNEMDWQEAYELRDQLYVTTKNAICMPDHNFDFTSIYNLLNRGMSLIDIKRFLALYNNLIKNRLSNKYDNEEVNAYVVEKINEFRWENTPEHSGSNFKFANNFDSDFKF
jgi:anaerobic magnesium-protoporphyrin IX monomethyl ester cyclase